MTVLRHYERQRRNRKNPGIASLHCVSVAMTNLRCVSPENITSFPCSLSPTCQFSITSTVEKIFLMELLL